MSEIIIANFKDPRLSLIDAKVQVEEIFFDTSTKKDFKDEAERLAFRWKYLDFYLSHYPEYAWVAFKDGKVLGYVLGMPFTHDPSLYQIQPHLKVFEDQFLEFPAHLHINCHHSSRGLGVGRLLVKTLLDQLSKEGVKGLHIMTGTESENRHFYLKLGFLHQLERNNILLMGILF
jgi:GNAT superfamily N-acetyltransferase